MLETDEGMVSASLKDASRSSEFKDCQDRIKTMLKSLKLLDPNRSKPHTLVQVGSLVVLTLCP